MTDLRKAAEIALEALDSCEFDYDNEERQVRTFDAPLVNAAHRALHQALAQPEQVSIEPPDYVEPITFDYHEGWEEGFKAGVESVKNKKESTPSNVDPLLHGGDGNYIKQAQPEQEPVAWEKSYGVACALLRQAHDILAMTQYPIKRPWVSLTDKEIENLELPNNPTVKEFVRFIEAALRSKNNG